MKTIREWLETLPDDIRDRALANVNAQRAELHMDLVEPSLSEAVHGAFSWLLTPEGCDYWFNVSCGKTPNLETKSKC